MKLHRKNLLLAASALITVALTASSASATNLYWDTDIAATPGAGGATPSGTWGTLGLTWSTDSTGSIIPTALTTTGIDDLFFWGNFSFR